MPDIRKHQVRIAYPIDEFIIHSMRFKPLTEKYDFNGESLVEHYPDYIRVPVANWIRDTLWEAEIWYDAGDIYRDIRLKSDFLDNLNILFRENFPRTAEAFLSFVFLESERSTDIINLCLQNYATTSQSRELESILERGGSAYAVLITNTSPISQYTKGVSKLTRRVPAVVLAASQQALTEEVMLNEAWSACYSRNPDYERVVSRCCDVLEKTWNKYFPTDLKPQVKKFVHGLRAKATNFTYKGSTVVSPANLVTDIAETFSDIRGQHSSGTGRAPSKDEAEFVLHYTIFIWNIER
jgi:hypothetical protein